MAEAQRLVRGDFTLSARRQDVDVLAVHRFLSRSYWADGIPLETVQRSIDGSMPFSVLHRGAQVAFARVITDRATFAYLSDVYVLEEFRGQGLSSWMMEMIMSHPDLAGVRRFMLTTRDAHGLYRRYGFTEMADPSAVLAISRPSIYREG